MNHTRVRVAASCKVVAVSRRPRPPAFIQLSLEAKFARYELKVSSGVGWIGAGIGGAFKENVAPWNDARKDARTGAKDDMFRPP